MDSSSVSLPGVTHPPILAPDRVVIFSLFVLILCDMLLQGSKSIIGSALFAGEVRKDLMKKLEDHK